MRQQVLQLLPEGLISARGPHLHDGVWCASSPTCPRRRAWPLIDLLATTALGLSILFKWQTVKKILDKEIQHIDDGSADGNTTGLLEEEDLGTTAGTTPVSLRPHDHLLLVQRARFLTPGDDTAVVELPQRARDRAGREGFPRDHRIRAVRLELLASCAVVRRRVREPQQARREPARQPAGVALRRPRGAPGGCAVAPALTVAGASILAFGGAALWRLTRVRLLCGTVARVHDDLRGKYADRAARDSEARGRRGEQKESLLPRAERARTTASDFQRNTQTEIIDLTPSKCAIM